MVTLELSRFRSLLWAAMCTCALAVAVLNSRFLWMDIRRAFHHSVDHLGQRDFSLYLHLYTSPVILIVGALLFQRSLRLLYPRVHRWAGRAYVVAILITSIATLHLSIHANEGPMTALGFGVLSVLWFVTAALAWLRAAQGRYEEHSAWMVRNYALTLTNVTFRIDLHVLLLLGADVNTVYDAVRALQPIPNLIIAELLIRTNFLGSDTWRDWWRAIGHWSTPTWEVRNAGSPAGPSPAGPRLMTAGPEGDS